MEHATGDGLTLQSDDDVTQTIQSMFGVNLERLHGVAHVVAVAVAGRQNLVLRIDDRTPSSAHDAFVLGVVRARAQVVITTGEILRSEPALRLDVYGREEMTNAIADWRREVVGEIGVPRTLLLTSGRHVPLDHPIFEGENEVIIFTGKDAPPPFVSKVRARDITVHQIEQPGIRAALEYLRDRYGLSGISIEAGPSTAMKLYDESIMVDEMFISRFHGPVEPSMIAGEFLDSTAVSEMFTRHHRVYRVATEDGTWTFHHLLRGRV